MVHNLTIVNLLTHQYFVVHHFLTFLLLVLLVLLVPSASAVQISVVILFVAAGSLAVIASASAATVRYRRTSEYCTCIMSYLNNSHYCVSIADINFLPTDSYNKFIRMDIDFF